MAHGRRAMAKQAKKTAKKAAKQTATPPYPSRMPAGSRPSPSGDIGEQRQRESVAAGGFTDGATVSAARALPYRAPAMAKGD